MEKFAATFTHLLLCVTVAWALGIGLGNAGAAPKRVIEPAPPQPVEQKVTVKRAGQVDISLRIYGTRAQTLSWVIRERPAHGKLANLRATGAESALVTYVPPSDLRVTADRFTFSARSNEGVSAAVEVLITITDEDPRLEAPGELDFGTVLVGAKVVQPVEFTNAGGGSAAGELAVDEPWRIEGARRYKLATGERRKVKIVFAPERGGEFSGEVRFTSQPDRVTFVRGVAKEPLAVLPAQLELHHPRGRPLRTGVFELRNNTDEALDVTLIASQRLLMPATLHLAPQGAARVNVQTAESDVAPLEETIRLAAGTLTARLPVKAAAVPGIVRARTESVNFRPMSMGATGREQLAFENKGGLASRVSLAVGPPFSLEENGFLLEPGASREIAITLAAAAPGRAQAALTVTAEGEAFEIPLAAVVLEKSAPAGRVGQRPARTDASADEPPAQVPAAIFPGSLAATVVSVNGRSATFRWPGETAQGVALRCLLRTLTLDKDGELKATFDEYPDCTFARRDGMNLATVEKLEPGKTYLFRIDAPSPDRSPPTPLTFAQVQTPPAISRWPELSLVRILTALALLAGGIAIWQRMRPDPRS